jgi:glucosyl-3-phosphoglycerate synthase
MWRSLSVARGDIVMYADADTRDFGEHFICGPLGPLLTLPRVQFSKAAYRRPYSSGTQTVRPEDLPARGRDRARFAPR